MKRVKKLYSLNESTIDFIKEYAKDLNISESWALDMIIANFERMMNARKKKPNDSRIETNDPKEFMDQYYHDYLQTNKK